jgi:hypothetical protein
MHEQKKSKQILAVELFWAVGKKNQAGDFLYRTHVLSPRRALQAEPPAGMNKRGFSPRQIA